MSEDYSGKKSPKAFGPAGGSPARIEKEKYAPIGRREHRRVPRSDRPLRRSTVAGPAGLGEVRRAKTGDPDSSALDEMLDQHACPEGVEGLLSPSENILFLFRSAHLPTTA